MGTLAPSCLLPCLSSCRLRLGPQPLPPEALQSFSLALIPLPCAVLSHSTRSTNQHTSPLNPFIYEINEINMDIYIYVYIYTFFKNSPRSHVPSGCCPISLFPLMAFFGRAVYILYLCLLKTCSHLSHSGGAFPHTFPWKLFSSGPQKLPLYQVSQSILRTHCIYFIVNI